MTDHDLPSWQRELRSWRAIYRSAAAQCERVGADDPGESIRLEGQANARIAGLLMAAAAGDQAGARNAAEALAAFERAAVGRHSRRTAPPASSYWWRSTVAARSRRPSPPEVRQQF